MPDLRESVRKPGGIQTVDFGANPSPCLYRMNERAVEAATLHAGGLSYSQIALRLRTSKSMVNYWLDPLAKQKQASYRASRPEQTKAIKAKYDSTEKGKERRRQNKKTLRCRLSNNLRNRLYCALWRKRCKKHDSSCRELGCSIDELMFRFEFFWPQFSWSEYGKQWQIDHIRPLASFDLSNPEQCEIACNFANLQPLTPHDNAAKSAKYEPVVCR